MRLLAISLGTLVIVAMILAMAHFWGLSQVFPPYDSDFWKTSQKVWVAPWEQNFVLEGRSEWILWADVYRNEKQDLLVKPWTERALPNNKLEQNSSPTRPLLRDLLMKFSNSRFIINVTDNVMGIHEQTAKVIEETSSAKRVLIQSDFNTVLTSIKKLMPELIFGSTPADLMRFKSFDSMWIVTATPFKGDVLVAPLKLKDLPAFNDDILNEIHRRNKKFILGPVKSLEQIKEVLTKNPDGVFVEDPLIVLKNSLQL